MTMRRIVGHQQFRGTTHSFVFLFFFIRPVAAEIAIYAISIWTAADPCARSCAFFLSSSYSASASCPPNNVAGCLCPSAGHSVASVAHNCAATTCWTSSTYTEAPPYARGIFTYWCASNNYPIWATTDSSSSYGDVTTPSAGQKFSPASTTSPIQLSSTPRSPDPSSITQPPSTQAATSPSITLESGKGVSLSTPSLSKLPTATSNGSSTNSVNRGTDKTATSPHLSKGAKAGIAVGTFGFIATTIFLILFLLRRRKKEIRHQKLEERNCIEHKPTNGLAPALAPWSDRPRPSAEQLQATNDVPLAHRVLSDDPAHLVEQLAQRLSTPPAPSCSSTPVTEHQVLSTSTKPPYRRVKVKANIELLPSGEGIVSIPGVALLDTGAKRDFVSKNWLVAAKMESQTEPPLQGPRTFIANGDELNIEGSIHLKWMGECDLKISASCFNVVSGLQADFIIGTTTLDKEQVLLKNPNAMALKDEPPTSFEVVD